MAEWLRAEEYGDLYPWVRYSDPLREMPQAPVAALALHTGRPLDELHRLTGTSDLASLFAALGLPAEPGDPAGSSLTQVLRDLPPRLPRSAGHLLQNLQDRMAKQGRHVLTALRSTLRDAMRAAATPEGAGQQAATVLRRELGLGERPVEDIW